MQLNKDIRNIGVPASTYGENAIIESAQKKLTTENEVTEWIYAMFIKINDLGNIWFINLYFTNICIQVPKGCWLSELHAQLGKVVRSKPASKVPIMEDEAEDPKVGILHQI